MISTFAGLKIHANPYLGEAWTDWSGCRSPSRAKRRAKLGHPQRTVTRYKAAGTFYQTPDWLFAHPDDVDRLSARVAELADHRVDAFRYALLGYQDTVDMSPRGTVTAESLIDQMAKLQAFVPPFPDTPWPLSGIRYRK